MAIRKRTVKRDERFISTAKVATRPGRPFYTRLNAAPGEAGFDEFVDKFRPPHYKEGGRPAISRVLYFGMLFIGYFEESDGRRTLPSAALTAWFCGLSWRWG
jgi:hypothetical protein